MKARLKTPTLEVWQYAGITAPLWVIGCIEMLTNTDSDGLYLVRRSGKQRIEPGDWIIRNLDGDPEWMTDAEFVRKYEIVK